MSHPLDDPVRTSLLGAHAPLADRLGAALRYRPDVAPFVADPGPDEQAWRDLATLLGPDAMAVVAGPAVAPPTGWEVVSRLPGLQLVDDGVAAAPDDEAVVLGPADVPEMLALVKRTQPGPFRPRTVELGGYRGIRHAGELVAMAGERMRPPGWTEISAICTDDAHRGRGHASRLTAAVAHGIRRRGDTPFLHTAAQNSTAIRLYAKLGFRLRARTEFVALRVGTC